MKKLHDCSNDKFLVYHNQIVPKNKAPYIVFLHGLMSDMNGSKAIAIEKYCIAKGYNFIRFDNFGHGLSSGIFTDQTITDWLEGINLIISKLAIAPVLIIGSSIGGWLALLAAKLHSEKIIGIITLAAAVDCTENLIWNKFSAEDKRLVQQGEIGNFKGSNPACADIYPISYNLIADGRKYLMLEKGQSEIEVSCPVHLIHGMRDPDVPYEISLQTAEKLKSSQVIVKLIKDGDHRLARIQDLQILYNSIEEIIQQWNKNE